MSTQKKQMPQPTEAVAVATAEAFFARNKKRIILAAVALIVVVAGGYGINKFYFQPAQQKAQTQLTLGLELMMQAEQAQSTLAAIEQMPDSTLANALRQQGMPIPENADSALLAAKNYRATAKSQATELYNKALNGDGTFPGFLKLAKGSGAAANIATSRVGICYAKLGKYKEAIKALDSYSTQGDETVSPMVLAALANCYAADNQLDKAADTFKKAASKADNEALTPALLVEAAKMLEAAGKDQEALEIYQEVKADYPQYGLSQSGMMTSIVDMYIERASK